MKKLRIYMENGEYVLERINEFNHAWKRRFTTENGLKEGLDAYKPVMDQYEIEAAEDVKTLVNYLIRK